MDNKEIRTAIKAAGLFQYQVARECGVNEVTFIRWLREPLSQARAVTIQKAIRELAAERKECVNG